MTQYNAIGEVDVTPTEKRTDAWLDRLTGYHAAVGRTDDGRAEIVVTYETDAIFELAVTIGLTLLTRAAGQLRAFTVMTTAEYDRRTDALAGDELMSTTEVADFLNVSRQRVLQLVNDGTLPRHPVGRTLAFSRQLVEAYKYASGGASNAM